LYTQYSIKSAVYHNIIESEHKANFCILGKTLPIDTTRNNNNIIMYIKYIKQLLGRTRGEGTPQQRRRRRLRCRYGEGEGSYLYANALDFYTPEELQKRTFGIGS